MSSQTFLNALSRSRQSFAFVAVDVCGGRFWSAAAMLPLFVSAVVVADL